MGYDEGESRLLRLGRFGLGLGKLIYSKVKNKIGFFFFILDCFRLNGMYGCSRDLVGGDVGFGYSFFFVAVVV